MAGYIGTTPVPQATQHRESFTATGGQTSFATVGYTPQFIDVYLNGVKLAPADYTATNGSDVVLASGATASDILEIVAYTPFEVANQTFTGDTSVTNLAVTGTFTSRGIDDNADAVAITIDSSENVGIGTSSPATPLHIVTSGNTAAIFHSTTNNSNLVFTDASTTANVAIGTVSGDNFRVQMAGAERMRIDSSGNVGIGTSSPQSGLHVVKGTADVFRLERDATNDWRFQLTGGALAFRDATNDAERMRLDASGNLLVGQSSSAIPGAGNTTTGISVSGQYDAIYASRSGGQPLVLNRNTSDGVIADFRKDGSTVGSIGTQAGTLQIDGTSGSTGLLFGASNIYPRDNGANSDGGVDIGGSSIRFKDLYLSGGVYLGGTGAANKLDDYEYGTWTPSADFATTSPSGGATTGTGAYTKVGNSVTVWGSCNNINVTGSAGTIKITGLPFAAKANAGLALYAGTVRMSAVNIANSYCVAEIRDGESRILIMEMIDNANSANLTTADFTHGQSDMFFTVNYQTA